MKPICIGLDEHQQPVDLTHEDRLTHVHGIGAPRTGKSKLAEFIAHEILWNEEALILIDPDGPLYQALVRWLAHVDPPREIILFDPSSTNRIVGFNPFRRQDPEGDVSAQVDPQIQALIKAWGMADTDQTPRLERYLRCICHVMVGGGYSFEVTRYLFFLKYKRIREHLTASVKEELVFDEWDELEYFATKRPERFVDQLDSTKSKFFRFLGSPQIRRIMGLPFNNIDLTDIIENRKILLVNLQPKPGVLTEQNAELIGALLLNEIWEVAKYRKENPEGEPPSAFHVILDEFQRYLIPNIPRMLVNGPKYGLHLYLFHQFLSQLRDEDPKIYNAVMATARTKMIFGGLTKEDATIVVENIFPGQIDLGRIMFLAKQTRIWPRRIRDKVFQHGRSHQRSTTRGQSWDAEGNLNAEQESDTEGDVDSYLTSDVPGIEHIPYKERPSAPVPLANLLWEKSDQIMQLFQRHYFVSRPEKKTIPAVTPWVETFPVDLPTIQAYIEEKTQQFLTASQVDKELEKIKENLALEAGVKIPTLEDETELLQ